MLPKIIAKWGPENTHQWHLDHIYQPVHVAAFDILGLCVWRRGGQNSPVNYESCQVNPWLPNKRQWLSISTALGRREYTSTEGQWHINSLPFLPLFSCSLWKWMFISGIRDALKPSPLSKKGFFLEKFWWHPFPTFYCLSVVWPEGDSSGWHVEEPYLDPIFHLWWQAM